MKRLIASIALAACAFSAWALPSVEDVQAEVRAGNYTRAESMMLEVVTAKPGSARAHYLYAEILAHDRRFKQASEEAAQAKRLDPALGFTDPDKFRNFEQLLAREQSAAQRSSASSTNRPAVAPVAQAPVQRDAGMPSWVWVLGAGAIALVIWRMVRPQPSPASGPAMAQAYGQPGVPAPYGPGTGYGPGNGPGYGPGAAPGYGPGGPGYGPGGVPMQGARSGMLGTGLAVAGGLAAGVLAEKFMEGHRDRFGSASGGRGDSPSNAGLFGGTPMVDDGAARELEQRDVDFGTGGNDWGGDDGGSSSGGSDGW